MLEIATVEELRGRHVVDPDGGRIGTVDEIYLDDVTGRPDWALVHTGLFGLKSSFVLITDARETDGEVVVPFDKATVKHAPRIDPDGVLTVDEETTLFAHYGLDHGRPGSATAASDVDATSSGAGATPGGRTGDARTPADLVAERRGPAGPTGRGEDEDPVPPDGGPPPRQDRPATPPGATDGHEAPSAVAADVPKPAGAPASPANAGEHWEERALPEHGNATATPEHGPSAAPSERDALEAPETGDAAAPGGDASTGRARLRKYVAGGGSGGQGPA